MATSSINNIFLDLGGVLLDIDVAKTVTAYNAMRRPGAPEVDYHRESKDRWFSRLDCGEIEIDEFAQGLKDSFQLEGNLEEIKAVWASLLLNLFPGRTEAVQRLAQTHQVALLSNTSRYHFHIYEPECRDMFGAMHHVFVSFELGVNKPNPAIYAKVLEKTGWKAEETLFLDDSLKNLEAAEAAGIQTLHIGKPEDFELIWERLGLPEKA
ncbi:MAG: HAD family phosphatase [Bacteroidota bacterium]